MFAEEIPMKKSKFSDSQIVGSTSPAFEDR